jgi:hypothetical protein
MDWLETLVHSLPLDDQQNTNCIIIFFKNGDDDDTTGTAITAGEYRYHYCSLSQISVTSRHYSRRCVPYHASTSDGKEVFAGLSCPVLIVAFAE